eukprot:c5036_g1_i1.p1 GENE.c5036_g1_i1~~c5036_g1_i1.p1  ORF type:complete len:863 (+),score=319.74 c5036_g1_i1:203-2590(+)
MSIPKPQANQEKQSWGFFQPFQKFAPKQGEASQSTDQSGAQPIVDSGLFGTGYLDFSRSRTDEEVRRFDERMAMMAHRMTKDEENNVDPVARYTGVFGNVLKERRQSEARKEMDVSDVKPSTDGNLELSAPTRDAKKRWNTIQTVVTGKVAVSALVSARTRSAFTALPTRDDVIQSDPVREEYIEAAVALLDKGDIRGWLTTIGAPQLSQIFETNEIDLQALLLCTKEDWQRMGITKKGPLQKILLATEAVKDVEAKMQAEGRLRDRQWPTLKNRYRILRRANIRAFGSVMLCQDLELLSKAMQETKGPLATVTLRTGAEDWFLNEGAVLVRVMPSETAQLEDASLRNEIWKQDRCMNILNVLSQFSDVMGQSYLALEPPVSSLADHLITTKMSEPEKLKCLGDIACGLSALHSCGFVGCDLSSENIVAGLNLKPLLEDDRSWSISKATISWKLASLETVVRNKTEVLVDEFVRLKLRDSYPPPEFVDTMLMEMEENAIRKERHDQEYQRLWRRKAQDASLKTLEISRDYDPIHHQMPLRKAHDVFCFGVLMFTTLFGPVPTELLRALEPQDQRTQREKLEQDLAQLREQQKVTEEEIDATFLEIENSRNALLSLPATQMSARVSLQTKQNSSEAKWAQLKKDQKQTQMVIDLLTARLNEKEKDESNKKRMSFREFVKVHTSVTTTVGELLCQLLDEDPKKRPSMKRVKRHPLFEGHQGAAQLDQTFFPLLGISRTLEEQSAATVEQFKEMKRKREVNLKNRMQKAAQERQKAFEELKRQKEAEAKETTNHHDDF